MPDWRARRDAPDVAAFVNRLRVETGQSVFLAGFSDGARTALLAAGLCATLSGLVFHSGMYRDEDLATSIPSCPVLCAWGERDVFTPTDRQSECLWNDLVARGVSASRAIHAGGHEWTADCSRLVLDWCEPIWCESIARQVPDGVA
jgi:predicted esterase